MSSNKKKVEKNIKKVTEPVEEVVKGTYNVG